MGGMDIGFAEQCVVHKDSISELNFIAKDAVTPGFIELKRLPFEIIFQNDVLDIAEKISTLNNWNHNFHLKDIRDIIANDLTLSQTTLPSTADVVIGGFPCQDFSHAGKRLGFESERGNLYQSFVETVRRSKPKVFIAENVNGLLTMPGNPINTIIRDFEACGYMVQYQLVKCEEYGIPQTRWRVIIMGILKDALLKTDAETNKTNDLITDISLKLKDLNLDTNWNVLDKNKTTCKVGSYFKHLREPNDTTDPAQKMYSKAKKLTKGQGQSEVLLTDFAPTMRAEHHGNIEFRRLTGGKNNEPGLMERRLSVREAALIQTFPPDCKLTFDKPSMVAYKTIGNAVPPLLGYLLASKVLEILHKMSKVI